MTSSEIWSLIYVVVGAILGFVLSLLAVQLQNKQKKREFLRALFEELDYNKKLIINNEKEGYDTSAYTDAKESKYFFDLPRELRNKINEAQIILINAQLRDNPHLYYHDKLEANISRLKSLFNEIIPEFKKYVDKL